MEIFVYSRYGLEAARPHEAPHVILSITSGPDDHARLRQNRERRGVLRLSFPDAEAASEQYAGNDLFSAEHAKQVRDFVLRHRQSVERIVVHCRPQR